MPRTDSHTGHERGERKEHTSNPSMAALDIPSPTKQALMMMKGIEIFLEPNMTGSVDSNSGHKAFGTAPPYIDIVSSSASLPKKPRTLKDMNYMVTMVPKDAILLTILLDGTREVYICEYVMDKDKDLKDLVVENWWKASAYALQTFLFQKVFEANTIVHGWLHFNKKNEINLGIFDISIDKRQPMHHMKIEHRSCRLHGIFCDAVQQHANVGHLSWIWTGQLGHDEMGPNSKACGACEVVVKDNWCFDIDYFLKFTDNQKEYELIKATNPNLDHVSEQPASNVSEQPASKRRKCLSVLIPTNV